MLVKQKVIDTINEMSDTFSMDELFEKIYIVEKIEKGLEQANNGDTLSEKELDIEIKKWFE